MKNKIKFISIVITLSIILSGCSLISDNGDSEKLQIMTTLFPIYDFSKYIVQDKGEVSILVPPGVETHSYEPSPRDIVNVRSSDIFIYTGEAMEPWAHRIIDNAKNDDVIIINSGAGINLLSGDEHKEEESSNHEEETSHYEEETSHSEENSHGDEDPHIWVDPILAISMVENILNGIIEADPENEDFYRTNADELIEKLHELDDAFKDLVLNSNNNVIMFGGHFAFQYFIIRYNLEYLSPYIGFAPNAEPTPQKIAQLIDNMNDSGTKVIYYEELVEPRVAKVISDQTGAQMLLLHAAHNVTKEDLDEGVTYFDLMYINLENLKIGLEYEK